MLNSDNRSKNVSHNSGTFYSNMPPGLTLTEMRGDFLSFMRNNSANIPLFKVKNGNTIKRYEPSSKLTLKTPERHR